MNDLCVDIGWKSINHYGEQLCGDHVDIVENGDNSQVIVLADGLGSGVKASILSTLTSKIISTMMAEGLSVEDCVETIMATLPVCSVRGVAYSTFTIIHIADNREAEIIEYDNPQVIVIRNGEEYPVRRLEMNISGKKVYRSSVTLADGDFFIAMSDGAIYAGVGEILNYGWQRENIVTFIEEHYNWTLTAKTITSLISDECNRLYANRPGDDTTIATVQVRKRKTCNLMIGPPADDADDAKMLGKFFAEEGKHIVCGGTSSNIVARYLGKEMETELDYFDPHIPPTAKIEGVDLVTEGVITISRVLEYAKNYLDNNSLFEEWGYHKDGASRIARLLFQEATDVNFYAGRAINSAHQNPDLPITFSIKMRLIEELSECLKKMGKTVHVFYY